MHDEYTAKIAGDLRSLRDREVLFLKLLPDECAPKHFDSLRPSMLGLFVFVFVFVCVVALFYLLIFKMFLFFFPSIVRSGSCY